MLTSFIGSVTTLSGVLLGGWLTQRHYKTQIKETQRQEQYRALSSFIAKSIDSHTVLLEQVFASESENALYSPSGASDTDWNQKQLAEINRLVAVINRFLGDLRAQSLILRLTSSDAALQAALDRFDSAIAEAFDELSSVCQFYEQQGEKFTAVFKEIAQEYSQLSTVSTDSPPDLLLRELNARQDSVSSDFQQSLRDWRTTLLRTAINFRVESEVNNVIDAGRPKPES